MSSIDTVQCDGCGEEVREGLNKGWIRINATEDYSIDIVMGDDEYTPIATEQKDFCSTRCLCSWIKKEYLAKSPAR